MKKLLSIVLMMTLVMQSLAPYRIYAGNLVQQENISVSVDSVVVLSENDAETLYDSVKGEEYLYYDLQALSFRPVIVDATVDGEKHEGISLRTLASIVEDTYFPDQYALYNFYDDQDSQRWLAGNTYEAVLSLDCEEETLFEIAFSVKILTETEMELSQEEISIDSKIVLCEEEGAWLYGGDEKSGEDDFYYYDKFYGWLFDNKTVDMTINGQIAREVRINNLAQDLNGIVPFVVEAVDIDCSSQSKETPWLPGNTYNTTAVFHYSPSFNEEHNGYFGAAQEVPVEIYILPRGKAYKGKYDVTIDTNVIIPEEGDSYWARGWNAPEGEDDILIYNIDRGSLVDVSFGEAKAEEISLNEISSFVVAQLFPEVKEIGDNVSIYHTQYDEHWAVGNYYEVLAEGYADWNVYDTEIGGYYWTSLDWTAPVKVYVAPKQMTEISIDSKIILNEGEQGCWYYSGWRDLPADENDFWCYDSYHITYGTVDATIQGEAVKKTNIELIREYFFDQYGINNRINESLIIDQESCHWLPGKTYEVQWDFSFETTITEYNETGGGYQKKWINFSTPVEVYIRPKENEFPIEVSIDSKYIIDEEYGCWAYGGDSPADENDYRYYKKNVYNGNVYNGYVDITVGGDTFPQKQIRDIEDLIIEKYYPERSGEEYIDQREYSGDDQEETPWLPGETYEITVSGKIVFPETFDETLNGYCTKPIYWSSPVEIYIKPAGYISGAAEYEELVSIDSNIIFNERYGAWRQKETDTGSIEDYRFYDQLFWNDYFVNVTYKGEQWEGVSLYDAANYIAEDLFEGRDYYVYLYSNQEEHPWLPGNTNSAEIRIRVYGMVFDQTIGGYTCDLMVRIPLSVTIIPDSETKISEKISIDTTIILPEESGGWRGGVDEPEGDEDFWFYSGYYGARFDLTYNGKKYENIGFYNITYPLYDYWEGGIDSAVLDVSSQSKENPWLPGNTYETTVIITRRLTYCADLNGYYKEEEKIPVRVYVAPKAPLNYSASIDSVIVSSEESCNRGGGHGIFDAAVLNATINGHGYDKITKDEFLAFFQEEYGLDFDYGRNCNVEITADDCEPQVHEWAAGETHFGKICLMFDESYFDEGINGYVKRDCYLDIPFEAYVAESEEDTAENATIDTVFTLPVYETEIRGSDLNYELEKLIYNDRIVATINGTQDIYYYLNNFLMDYLQETVYSQSEYYIYVDSDDWELLTDFDDDGWYFLENGDRIYATIEFCYTGQEVVYDETVGGWRKPFYRKQIPVTFLAGEEKLELSSDTEAFDFGEKLELTVKYQVAEEFLFGKQVDIEVCNKQGIRIPARIARVIREPEQDDSYKYGYLTSKAGTIRFAVSFEDYQIPAGTYTIVVTAGNATESYEFEYGGFTGDPSRYIVSLQGMAMVSSDELTKMQGEGVWYKCDEELLRSHMQVLYETADGCSEIIALSEFEEKFQTTVNLTELTEDTSITDERLIGAVRLTFKIDEKEYGADGSKHAIIYLVEKSGKCGDNASWRFDFDTNTLTISGTGEVYKNDYFILCEAIRLFMGDEELFIRAELRTLLMKKGIRVEVQEGITGVGLDFVKIFREWKETLSADQYQYCCEVMDVETEEDIAKLNEARYQEIGGFSFSFCIGSEYSLPSTMKELPMFAFGAGAGRFKRIDIPSGVEKIDAMAFFETMLEEIYIPKSVKTIDLFGLYVAGLRANKLVVRYEGTEAEWKAIDRDHINPDIIRIFEVEEDDLKELNEDVAEYYEKYVTVIFETATVAKESGDVSLEGYISGDTLEISKVEIKKQAGDITVDFAAEKPVNSVKFSTDALMEVAKELDDGESLILSTGDQSIAINKEALDAILTVVGGSGFTVTNKEVEVEVLTKKQKDALAADAVGRVIQAEIVGPGGKITTFGGGKLEISFDFTMPQGKTFEDYELVYVAEDGTKTSMPFSYANGEISFLTDHLSTYVLVEKNAIPKVLSSKKVSVNESYISKITLGTTVSALKDSFNEKQYVKIFKDGKEVTGSVKVGTGMTVCIMDGSKKVKTYTAIVYGDTNGDGEISITDMLSVKADILKKSKLSGVYAAAADTNGDGSISVTDFLQIKAKILKKSEITQRAAK